MSDYRPPEGFLTLAQARERLGVSKATAQKLVREAGLEVFNDHRDKRVSLYKESDIDRLMQPVRRSAPGTG